MSKIKVEWAYFADLSTRRYETVCTVYYSVLGLKICTRHCKIISVKTLFVLLQLRALSSFFCPSFSCPSFSANPSFCKICPVKQSSHQSHCWLSLASSSVISFQWTRTSTTISHSLVTSVGWYGSVFVVFVSHYFHVHVGSEQSLKCVNLGPEKYDV